jgi:hypothetical protein
MRITCWIKVLLNVYLFVLLINAFNAQPKVHKFVKLAPVITFYLLIKKLAKNVIFRIALNVEILNQYVNLAMQVSF